MPLFPELALTAVASAWPRRVPPVSIGAVVRVRSPSRAESFADGASFSRPIGIEAGGGRSGSPAVMISAILVVHAQRPQRDSDEQKQALYSPGGKTGSQPEGP